MQFHTQATLILEQSNSSAFTLFEKSQKDGFKKAEITEVINISDSKLQFNLNVNERIEGSMNCDFDTEILSLVDKLLSFDPEVIISFIFQDMNDDFFGVRIYGNASKNDSIQSGLLDSKIWSSDILNLEDEFYLDDITALQQQFLEERLPWIIQDIYYLKEYSNIINLMKEEPMPSPDVDCFNQNKGKKEWSGLDYAGADEKKLEWICDAIIDESIILKKIGATSEVGFRSQMTLIHEEFSSDLDNQTIVYKFSAYKLDTSSGEVLIVCLFEEGEKVDNTFEPYESVINFFDLRAKTRNLSSSVFNELSRNFIKQ